MTSKITRAARGQPCYLRLPGCSHDPEQTVLAHIRRGNTAGVGRKPIDLCGIPMDDHCHAIYDGRVKSEYSRAELDADALRGLCQWLTHLAAEGLVKT